MPVSDQGAPGLEIFKMAGKTISGWLPFEKTGAGPKSRLALPYATLEERDALLHLAFNPTVAYVQRGDIDKEFADAHRLGCRLPLPYVIPYMFEGREHLYYIDWVGILEGGKLFGVEASVEELKSDAQSQAKLDAAALHFRKLGGRFWLFLPTVVNDLRTYNLQRLNAHRPSFDGYQEIAPEIERLWLATEPVSIRALVTVLAERYGERLVEAAAWRRAALAVAEGRLVVDLDSVLLGLDTPLQLLPPHMRAIVPPELPSSLDEARAAAPPVEPVPVSLLPGRSVDPESLPEKKRPGFLRNLRAVLAVLAGKDESEVAREADLSAKQVRRLVARGQAEGEEGLVPYPHRDPSTEIDEVFLEPIRRLAKRRQKLGYQAIAQAPELAAAAKKAERATGKRPGMPDYYAVRRFVKFLETKDREVGEARSGQRHVPHSAMSVKGYVHSLPSPVIVAQVDEHTMDVFIVTDSGLKLTERVHAAVLICAKTGAIIGAVLSPRALTEEDYLRLIKQAMEPKDRIVARAGCVNSWPCYGRPVEILSDRGKFVTSEHGTTVLVERFGINQSFAPPYAPSVKGVVEALFRWITERFAHRLPGTSKSSPADRGTYESQAEALKAGITFSEFEALFYRAIVDGYMQDYDGLRGDIRQAIWDRDATQFGVPQQLGSPDETKLLLMRAHNPKHKEGLYLVQGGGISFRGHWYVGEEGLTARLRDELVGFLYDKRDIGTIYLIDKDGTVLGAAHCPDYADRRISIWEQDEEHRAEKRKAKEPRAISAGNLTTIIGDAQDIRRQRRKEAKAAARAQFLDGQQEEIHTAAALAERKRLAERLARGPLWMTDPSELPGPDLEPDDEENVVPFVRRRGRETL